MAPVWCGRVAQGYSNSGSLLGLLPLAAYSTACLFWPMLALSVGSGCKLRGCVRAGEGLMAGAKFCVGVDPSVCVWRGASTGGCSLGLRPLFLPGVAPFLTSALIPLFSTTFVLVLGATWVAAARNQFCDRERICKRSVRVMLKHVLDVKIELFFYKPKMIYLFWVWIYNVHPRVQKA